MNAVPNIRQWDRSSRIGCKSSASYFDFEMALFFIDELGI